MVCLVLLAAGATAQTKVVDKSAKKMPAWANTAVPDYLIVSVTAPTLAEAQKKSVQEITERIIQSVASSPGQVYEEGALRILGEISLFCGRTASSSERI